MESSPRPAPRWMPGLLAAGLVLAAGCGGVPPIKDPFNKAVAHASVGNLDGAIAEYREALAVDPADAFAAFNLGATLEAKAESLRETAGIRARVQRDTDAEDAAGRTVGEADELARPLIAEAADIYRGLIARPDTPPSVAVRAGVNIAAIRYENGEKEEAKSALRDLIAAHERSPIPRVALAAHLVREEDLESARPLLEQALKWDGANREANTLLGEVLARTGDTRGARDHYEKVLRRDEDDVAAHLAMARMGFADGNLIEARSHYQHVLYIRPRHFESHFRMAEICEREKNWTEAAWHYMEAERIDDARHPVIGRIDYRARMEALWRASRGGV